MIIATLSGDQRFALSLIAITFLFSLLGITISTGLAIIGWVMRRAVRNFDNQHKQNLIRFQKQDLEIGKLSNAISDLTGYLRGQTEDQRSKRSD